MKIPNAHVEDIAAIHEVICWLEHQRAGHPINAEDAHDRARTLRKVLLKLWFKEFIPSAAPDAGDGQSDH